MKRWFSRAFGRLFGSGLLIKQVVTILSGTATAQILTVAAMVPLARLYSPLDFGLYAIVQSIVTVGVTLAALRYDMATVLPESDLAARVLHRLASRSILVSSSVFMLAIVIAHPFIARTYENDVFATWLIGAGLAIYLMAQVVNVQFWLNRRQDYRAIAGNRLIQAVTVAAFQLALAVPVGGFQGLLAGLVAGQIVTLLLVRRRTPELKQPLPKEAPGQWEMARRYRKMPLVNGPTAVLDAVKNSGINVLIGNIAVSGLGQYSLAYQLTKAPVSLLNGAVAQVLLQRLATTEPGSMVRLLRDSFVRIFLFSAPIFVIFYFLAPSLFPFVFGAEWEEAGLIAQALVPWLFMLTFTSPLSSLFVIADKQEWGLVFALLSTSISLAYLVLTPLGLLPAVQYLSLIMAALLGLWVVMALLVARGYDKNGRRRANEVPE